MDRLTAGPGITAVFPSIIVCLAFALIFTSNPLPAVPPADRTAGPQQVLPPVPRRGGPGTEPQIPVKRIEIRGNHAVTDEELRPLTAPYQGQAMDTQALHDLRRAITGYYVDQGYINSGAIIPDQSLNDGVLIVDVIEGTLNEIEISGADWLDEDYVRDRIRLGNEEILNLNELQQRIRILQQDRLIERLDVELEPGSRRGRSRLKIQVEEAAPYEFGVSLNNWRSPSIGSTQLTLYGGIYNLSGIGDRLVGNFNLTDEFDDGNILYSLPLNRYDTRFNIYYDRTNTDISQTGFNRLDIRTATDTWGASLSQPVYVTANSEVLAELIFEKRRSTTYLFGVPFSFVPGPRDGVSDISVIRFAQQWTYRTPSEVLALRSVFNFGIDAFDATMNPGNIPDSRFFSWRGQFQWVRRLDDQGAQLILRTEAQLAAQSLLPMEKFAVGGATTVRGYRQNLLVRDNGVVASAEIRVPVFRLPLPYLSENADDGMVQLAAFFDFGWSRNTDLPTLGPTTIASPGAGIRWDPGRRLHTQLYWGYALRKIDTGGNHDLQDSGIHFLVDLQLF